MGTTSRERRILLREIRAPPPPSSSPTHPPPPRHTSRQRRIPMPASPRSRRAHTATKHESGPPDESLSSSACTQQSICRGAAPAGRLDPLSLSGDQRGRGKHLLFAVANGTLLSYPELVKKKRRTQMLRIPENDACVVSDVKTGTNWRTIL